MHCTSKKIILYYPHANRTHRTMTLLTTDRTPSTDSPAYDGWGTHAMLEDLLCRRFAGRIALVSSFGTESAVLLHLAAGIDRNIPVIFLDTGKLFPETLHYRDTLVEKLGLRDVRSVRPNARTIAGADAGGTLWESEPDQCCWHRKVEPLDDALTGLAAWITGRKRFQGGERGNLPLIEHQPDGRIRANPLVGWSNEKLHAYLATHGLPRHPLWDRGFRSIGCAPCTRATGAHEDARAGRWAGLGKTECGIHLARQGSLTQIGIAGASRDG